MKITLESHDVSDFQSIGSNQEFRPTSGLWSVIGKNLDEGGSNASGKSSFIRAIAVGLLGPSYIDVTIKELKNRYTDAKPKIIQVLDVDGKKLNINRTIGGKLSVSFDGKEIEGKTDEIQNKMLQLFGLTSDQIYYLTHKAQGSFGGFLKKKDTEKKEFLGSFFDLEKLESASYSISLELQQGLAKSEALMTSIIQLRAKVAELDTLVAEASQKVDERMSAKFTAEEILTAGKILEYTNEKIVLEEQISKLKHSYIETFMVESPSYPEMVASAERLKKVSEESDLALSSVNVRMIDVLAALDAKVEVPKDLTDTLGAIDMAISNFHKVMSEKTSLAASAKSFTDTLTKSENAINSMKQDTCDKCGQPVSSHLFEQIRKSAMASHEELATKYAGVQSRLDELNKFCTGAEIVGLTQARDQAVNAIDAFKKSRDNTSLKIELDSLKSRTKELRSVTDSAKREFQTLESYVKNYAHEKYKGMLSRVSEINISLSSLETLKREMARQLESLKESLKSLEGKRLKATHDIRELEEEHVRLSADLYICTKTAEVLSKTGFLGHAFDSILNEVNGHVNENLKSIHVASKLSLNFTPDTVVKSTKSISKTISYKLFSGTDEVSFETLSGGEQLSVILSVDEALDAVLSKRLGVSLSWKVFDEQLFWVDEYSKESILDFLRSKATDKTYIIIDHASEFNAAIENRITVTKKNGISTVEICQ